MKGFFKRFLRKASGEALLSRMEAEQPSPVGTNPYVEARQRIIDRSAQIAKLRQQKKRFSHLRAEQQADYRILQIGQTAAFAACKEKAGS